MRWLALLLLLFVSPAFGQGYVQTKGRHFVAADGQVLQLKGINLGNWLMPEGYMFKFEKAKSPRLIFGAFERVLGPEENKRFWTRFRDTYIGQDDIKFIKSVGFNLIRIPLHHELLVEGGEGWALLDRVVGWAKEAGLYVVMDIHAAPGGQTGINHDDGPGYPLMFYVPQHKALTVKLWAAIAKRYAGNPTILGYDLLNEPIAPYHDKATLNSRLEPFYKEITAAIRAVDPDRIIFLAGPQWSSTFDTFGPPFAKNLAYTYHSFWASTKRDSIQRHLNFSARHDVPLFIGETGELTDAWNKGFRELHERHGIGWSFWTYKNLDTPSTVVSIPRPQGWDGLVAFADRQSDVKPPASVAWQYLDSVPLSKSTIRWSYLASLGLKAAP
jgi:endoglucanase